MPRRGARPAAGLPEPDPGELLSARTRVTLESGLPVREVLLLVARQRVDRDAGGRELEAGDLLVERSREPNGSPARALRLVR